MEIGTILGYVQTNRFSLEELAKMINDYAFDKAEYAVERYRNRISNINSRLRKFREKEFEKDLNDLLGSIDDVVYQNKLALREEKYKEAKRRSRERKKVGTGDI